MRHKKISPLQYSLFCLIIGIFLSLYYIFTSDFSFTILPQNHSAALLSGTNKELTAGKKATGSINPTHNNLGIIAIRFNTYNRENDDQIIFRIKEKDASTWYRETEYRTTFGNNALYNFGFPPIDRSAGKTYLFEIESLRGRNGNAISISTFSPVLVSKYKYPKQILSKQPTELYRFLKAKMTYILLNTNAVFASIIFLVPFFHSFLYKNKNRKVVATSMLFFLMMVDIAVIKESRSIIAVTVFIMWYWFMSKNNKASFHTFSVATLMLILVPILYTINGESSAVKAAVWVWILLFLGILFCLQHPNETYK